MQESNYWKRLASKRVSRRTLLGAGATTALGGAAALVVGCGGGDDDGNGGTKTIGPSRTPFTGDPKFGGSITWGRSLSALGIDPHIDLTGLDIDLLLYSYLYGWIPGKEEIIFNNFAESFEHPDPVTFIYTLRPGFKIHEGGPGAGEDLNSMDVKQSWVRRGVSITAPDKRFPRKIAGSADPAALEAALETPDDLTFKFVMSEPFVPAVREMANPTWAVVPAKVIDEYLSLSQVAYGSGPFALEEFRGSERIVLKKHPNYVANPRPYLDGITFIVIQEQSSLLSAFKNGQHDVNGSVLSREDYDDFAEDPDFTVAKAPSLFYPVIHLKMRPPFDDIKVREALDLGIDRDELMLLIQGGEGNYNGPIQWPQEKWALPQQEIRDFYKYDPERAKQLLADAGYEDGFSTRLKVPKLSGINFIADMATVLRDQFSRINLDVQIDEVELGAFIGSTLLPGNFDMAFFPNLPYDEPDRPLSFYHSLGVTGSGNWNNYSNRELDALIDAQAKEFDEVKRKEIILEAQRLILPEHGPQLTLTGGFQYSARWNYVHFPFEIDEEPPEDVGPYGVDIWTEKA